MLNQLHGSFALGIIFKDQPDLIVGARRGSPLAVGYGPNENYLGSDSYALFDERGNKVNKKILELSSNEKNYDKGEYKHFMAKEIDEQPVTIKNCINEYIDKKNNDINIFNFPWESKDIS